jgi:hypothetical protein
VNKDIVRESLQCIRLNLEHWLAGWPPSVDLSAVYMALDHASAALAELDKPAEPVINFTPISQVTHRESATTLGLSWQERYPTNYLYESPPEIEELKKHIAAAKPAEPTVLERLEATLEACHITSATTAGDIVGRVDLEKLGTGEYWVSLHIGAAAFQGTGRTLAEAINAALEAAGE